MFRSLVAASLMAAASAVPAQIHQTPLVDPKVAALRDAALAGDNYAWDITEGLTTEVGPRLGGTEAEARARNWAVKKLTQMGFANVRVEPFDMPVWVRGHESAEIVSPFPQPMAVAALGNSGSSGPDGVTGEIVAFDSVDALRAAPDGLVKGKIVFVDHTMPANQDGSGYGQFGAPRRQGPTIASQKGALAIIVRSIGTDRHRMPHTGAMSFDNGAKPIPAGALSNPDADQLLRILKRRQPVRMKLVLESQNIGTRQSGNVIAEVPGRDPSLPP
ncbi:MAG TPA: peptidase M28 family protein, partial [Sphingomicrobium sp.]|nr:peptidase M28 family protein [Sphingomicrobium sp.]